MPLFAVYGKMIYNIITLQFNNFIKRAGRELARRSAGNHLFIRTVPSPTL